MANQPFDVALDAQDHFWRDWLQLGAVLLAIDRYVHVPFVGSRGQILWCVF